MSFNVSFIRIRNTMIVGSNTASGSIFLSNFFAILSPFNAILDVLLILIVINVIFIH